MKAEGITEFITTMSNSLPEYTWSEGSYMVIGEDLILANHKLDGQGKPIEKNGLYPITGPVQIFFVDNTDVEEAKVKDGVLEFDAAISAKHHRRMMRKAWLSKGKTGLLSYLERFIEPAEMQGFRKQFLNV